MMPLDGRRQGTQQIARDVAISPPAPNGKSKTRVRNSAVRGAPSRWRHAVLARAHLGGAGFVCEDRRGDVALDF
jgi:hypothetical protein